MPVTIRARLLWLVAVALLPAIAILVYDQYLFRQQVFHDIEADARRVASLVGNQIQAQIQDTGRRCSLHGAPSGNPGDGRVVRRHAGGNPARHRYANLAIADADGRVVSSALPFAGEVSVRDRVFFGRVVEQGAFATGLFHLNPISPRQGLDMGCP